MGFSIAGFWFRGVNFRPQALQRRIRRFPKLFVTRVIHLGIIYRQATAKGDEVHILQSYPPKATNWPLEMFMQNRRFRGFKFLRLKPEARQVVHAEFERAKIVLDQTPENLDNSARLRKGEFGYLTASREPDSTTVVNGVEYGVVKLQPKETLYRLFGPSWKSVSKLDLNRDFMARHPGLEADKYEGDTIYYPIRQVAP